MVHFIVYTDNVDTDHDDTGEGYADKILAVRPEGEECARKS
jgi:hypothetical protein